MKKFPLSKVVLAALLVGGSLAGVTAISASVSTRTAPSSVTYYACLKSGTLTKVSTHSVLCATGYTLISWNQVGQVGPAGKPGNDGVSVTTAVEAPGNHCARGGISINSASGIVYVCNGAAGPTGATSNTCSSPPAPGLNFSACNLSSVNWSYVDLAGAQLASTNFSGASLNYVDLTGANLNGANLSGATLANTTLTGAIMSYASLAGVSSGGVVGAPTSLPTGWSIVGGFLVGPGANLSGTTLTSLNFAGVNLSGANLSGANLNGVNLTGTNLTGASLGGVSSGGLVGTPSALPAGWSVVGGYLVGPGANLAGANLSSAVLSGVNLNGANLTGANLNGANLTSTVLSGATLTAVSSGGVVGTPASLPSGWRLVGGYLIGNGANLANAVLTSANLNGADLTNAILTNATLTGTSLNNTKLIGSTLTGVTSGALTGTPSSLPTSWSIASGYLIGPAANLAGAALTSANLSGVTLSGANLTGANLTSANLTNAVLTGATFSSTNVTGVTWLNTTCPDGSNSSAHSNTCVGFGV